MLKEVWLYWCAKRIKNKVDTFTTCEFGSRNKITVSGYEYNLVDLMLISH